MCNRQGSWVILFSNPTTGVIQKTPYTYKTENGARRALLFLQDTDGWRDYRSKFIPSASDTYDFLEALYRPEPATVNPNLTGVNAMRINYCWVCGKPDMLDGTNRCLQCVCDANPKFAQELAQYQQRLREEREGANPNRKEDPPCRP